jgi:hypothetical protein
LIRQRFGVVGIGWGTLVVSDGWGRWLGAMVGGQWMGIAGGIGRGMAGEAFRTGITRMKRIGQAKS